MSEKVLLHSVAKKIGRLDRELGHRPLKGRFLVARGLPFDAGIGLVGQAGGVDDAKDGRLVGHDFTSRNQGKEHRTWRARRCQAAAQGAKLIFVQIVEKIPGENEVEVTFSRQLACQQFVEVVATLHDAFRVTWKQGVVQVGDEEVARQTTEERDVGADRRSKIENPLSASLEPSAQGRQGQGLMLIWPRPGGLGLG